VPTYATYTADIIKASSVVTTPSMMAKRNTDNPRM